MLCHIEYKIVCFIPFQWNVLIFEAVILAGNNFRIALRSILYLHNNGFILPKSKPLPNLLQFLCVSVGLDYLFRKMTQETHLLRLSAILSVLMPNWSFFPLSNPLASLLYLTKSLCHKKMDQLRNCSLKILFQALQSDMPVLSCPVRNGCILQSFVSLLYKGKD